MIKVILVEDDIEMLEGLKNVISWESLGFSIVGTARNGNAALGLVEKHQPDIIITDITMPIMGGLELISKAKKLHPNVKSVIISCHEEFEYAREALRLHANEYLLKHTLTARSLTHAIGKIKTVIDDEAKQFHNYYGMDANFADINAEQSYQLKKLTSLYESYGAILKDAVKESSGELLVDGARKLQKEVDGHYHPTPVKAILSKLLIELAIAMPDSHGISIESLQLKRGSRYFMDTIQLMAEKLTKLKYNTSNPDVLKAIAYIENNLDTDISGKGVAKHINMNSSYFSRLFSKELGISFSDFVLQKRITRATELLSNTKHSIDEIADMVGIESISYFYRIYKRITGRTPGGVRK